MKAARHILAFVLGACALLFSGCAEDPKPVNAPGAIVAPAKPRAGTDAKDCEFPQEAVASGVTDAFVDVRVHVAADGRPLSVTIVRDPGHGLAAAASRCAMSRSYDPAIDDRGQRVDSDTNLLRIRFAR